MAKNKSCVARIQVYPRQEVLDPQGKAISSALARLGFKQVSRVRAGKTFEVVLQGVSRTKAEPMLQEMCEKLLANTVMEDFEIEILDDAEGGS